MAASLTSGVSIVFWHLGKLPTLSLCNNLIPFPRTCTDGVHLSSKWPTSALAVVDTGWVQALLQMMADFSCA